MKIDVPNDRSANLWLDESDKPIRVGVTRLGRFFDEDGSGGYRVKYAWQVLDAQALVVEGNDHLWTGTDNGPVAMLGTLLSFMDACAEAYAFQMREPTADPENLALFPESMREWCYLHSDELAMARLEIEEQGWRI